MNKEKVEMTEEQKRTALTILYLNLSKLARNADQFIDETLERHLLVGKLDALIGVYPDANELY